jgi:hypothetical protein
MGHKQDGIYPSLHSMLLGKLLFPHVDVSIGSDLLIRVRFGPPVFAIPRRAGYTIPATPVPWRRRC